MEDVHPEDGKDQHNRERAAHTDQHECDSEVGPGHICTEPEARIARHAHNYADVHKLHRRIEGRRPLPAVVQHEAGRRSGSIYQAKAHNETHDHQAKDNQTEPVRRRGQFAGIGCAQDRPRQEVDSDDHQCVGAQVHHVSTAQHRIAGDIHGVDVESEGGSYSHSCDEDAVVASAPHPWQQAQDQSPDDGCRNGLDHPKTLSNDRGSTVLSRMAAANRSAKVSAAASTRSTKLLRISTRLTIASGILGKRMLA